MRINDRSPWPKIIWVDLQICYAESTLKNNFKSNYKFHFYIFFPLIISNIVNIINLEASNFLYGSNKVIIFTDTSFLFSKLTIIREEKKLFRTDIN